MRHFGSGIAVVGLVLATSVGAAGAGSPPKWLPGQPIYMPLTLGSPGAPQFATEGQSRFSAAPVPNLDDAAPVLKTLGPPQAQVAPSLFRRTKTYRGEGFTAGSTADGDQQRRLAPTAGVNVSMPLE